PSRVRSSATCAPILTSAWPAETSLTMRAPAAMLAAATEARMVSTLSTTSSAARASTTGITRRSSSSSGTRGAPGRVDSPPMSMIAAPSATRRRPWAIASGALSCFPPSEKESGVTFRTPMTRVSSPPRRSGRPAGRCTGMVTASPSVDQGHGLAAGTRVVPEHAAHGAGDGAGPGGAHAAHRHAHVLRLDHDDRAGRTELVHQRIGDLEGEPLLHLRASGVDVDQAGELAQPRDGAAAGDVP